MKASIRSIAAVVAFACVLLGAAAPRAEDIKNGGTMTITFLNDMATFDPAIGYNASNFGLIKSMFDGLMGYVPGTYTLEPRLAESFTVSPDGLTYTFKLRPGIKFHNGRLLTAADIVYSIDRVVNPKTKSPGQSFFKSIVGFEDRASGKSDHLAGIRAVDDRTVEIKLTSPSASILHILALNFSFAVPREEVEKAGGDFGKHPVGTGAFKLQDWQIGVQATLVRNPDYFRKGLPHLDKLIVKFGIDPVTAMLQLMNGEVDYIGDGIPPGKFVEVTKNPQYKDNLVIGPRLNTQYITMKVNQKPFDDKRVRLAVSYAINKVRINQLVNNRGLVTNQILPPGLGGYDKDFKGYDYDPAKAKQLLAEAGYPNGFSTELYASNTDPQPRVAQAIQQDLAEVGIKADLKVLASALVVAAAGSPDQAPMVWSGGLAWSADYPDTSNYWYPLLSCGSATKGTFNWSDYCNHALDTKADEANALADPAKNAQRAELWRQVFDGVMADAPWVPVYNDRFYIMKSKRIEGQASYFLTSAPVNYVNIYAAGGK